MQGDLPADRSERPDPPSLEFWEWLALATIMAVAGALRLRWADFDLDDAFITYAYARSLAEGYGLTFAGAPVLGTTTPLYALLLGSLQVLGVPMVLASKAIGLLAGMGSCALVYLLARASLGPWAAILASTLLAINARHALISMSGMETALYTCLALAACYCFVLRRPEVTALLAAAVCLLRPDGLLLAGVLAAAHLLQRRRPVLLPALAFSLPLALWGAFAWHAFGSPVPTSVLAKLAYPEYGSFRLEIAASLLGAEAAPALVAAAGLGLLYLVARSRELLPLAAWTALYLAAFTRAPNFSWYYAPPVPGMILTATAGLAALSDLSRGKGPLAAWWWEALRGAAASAAAAAVLFCAVQDAADYRRFMDRTYGDEVTGAYRSLALWLEKYAAPEARVAVPEVGYVGYYGGRRVLDLAGLCSPEVVPYLARGRYLEIVRDFRPEYVALTTEGNRPLHNVISGSTWFRTHYRPRRAFPYRGRSHYVLYELRRPTRLAAHRPSRAAAPERRSASRTPRPRVPARPGGASPRRDIR